MKDTGWNPNIMRNKFIKFCDANRLDSGLVREFLHKEKFEAAIASVKSYQIELMYKIEACDELLKMINTEQDNKR